VETNLAYINSEKSTTELNGPHYSEFDSRLGISSTLRVS
jgi:hypothetical protein